MAGKTHNQPLGELVELIRGTTYKSALLDETGPVLLGLATIHRNGGFRSDSLRTYGGDSPERLILRPGDIYVSLKDVTQSADLLGAVARVPADVSAGRLTQDTVKVKLKHGADADLVYWSLRTPEYREYCRSHATGTTNLGLARTDFLAFNIPTLSSERRVILNLLNAFDEKIEVNRQVAATLESIARALFKSWFVNFDPVCSKAKGHEIDLPADMAAMFPDGFDDEGLPCGWKLKRADDVSRSIRSVVEPTTLPPETPYVGLEHLPRKSLGISGHGYAKQVESGKLRFEAGDLLFGKLRPYFHKVSVMPHDGIASSEILVFRAKDEKYRGLMYFGFSEDSFVASASGASTGTRMPRAEWAFMSEQQFATDDGPVLEAFNKIALAHLAQIAERLAECQELEQLRDALLPKLLSGDLPIGDVEDAVAAA